MQFDVDGNASLSAELLGQANTHYLKNTAWLNAQDGFLVLDKNVNGTIDDGEEMFSNARVREPSRGIASLAGVDADGNNVIDANDPVFAQLRVWRDANGDGRVQRAEATSLADLGITALNYKLGTFVEHGQARQMSTLTLRANTFGVAYSPVAGGIKITDTDGHASLVVTQIHDLSSLRANEDGMDMDQDEGWATFVAHGGNDVNSVAGLRDQLSFRAKGEPWTPANGHLPAMRRVKGRRRPSQLQRGN